MSNVDLLLFSPPGNELSSQQLHRLPRQPEVIQLRRGQSVRFEDNRLWFGELPVVLRK